MSYVIGIMNKIYPEDFIKVLLLSNKIHCKVLSPPSHLIKVNCGFKPRINLAPPIINDPKMMNEVSPLFKFRGLYLNKKFLKILMNQNLLNLRIN